MNLKDMETKVSFSFNLEEGPKLEINGHVRAVFSGILMLVEELAEITGNKTSDIIQDMLNVAGIKEENPTDMTEEINEIYRMINEKKSRREA